MSAFAATVTAETEVWQRADGTWNWVLIFRPDLNRPADVIWDSTPHTCARAALADADRTIASWLGRMAPWDL